MNTPSVNLKRSDFDSYPANYHLSAIVVNLSILLNSAEANGIVRINVNFGPCGQSVQPPLENGTKKSTEKSAQMIQYGDQQIGI